MNEVENLFFKPRMDYILQLYKLILELELHNYNLFINIYKKKHQCHTTRRMDRRRGQERDDLPGLLRDEQVRAGRLRTVGSSLFIAKNTYHFHGSSDWTLIF